MPKREREWGEEAERTPSPKRARVEGSWHKSRSPTDTLTYGTCGAAVWSSKVAAFDMDGTLIRTKSGKTHPTNKEDWKFWNASVPEKLRDLHEKGFAVVIFTNQAGVSGGKQRITDITSKIEAISAGCGVPFTAYIATAKDIWRKPGTGGWDLLSREVQRRTGKPVSLEHSFYVGDAAGRPARYCDAIDELIPKDFSCTDRKFADNVGLDFQTPEEFFLAQGPEKFEWGGPTPWELVMKLSGSHTPPPPTAKEGRGAELIVCVGYPGCGKSTFCRKYLLPHGYHHVNQDTLKSKEACIKSCGRFLEEGKRVVVDNTNPGRDVRAAYISLARKHGVPARCFHFTASKHLAAHMNRYRERETRGERKRVPEMAYNAYASRYNEPSTGEGFERVESVVFSPDFGGEGGGAAEREFYQWTE